MPFRFDKREGESIEVLGVPITLVRARGGKGVFLVGGYDEDGLLESREDCEAAGRRLAAKIDKSERLSND
jgi:hypothetical protein